MQQNVMICECGQEAKHRIRNRYMCDECIEEEDKYAKLTRQFKHTKEEKCRKARWDYDD